MSNKDRGAYMQKIIAANWKMHKIRKQAAETAAALALDLPNGAPDNRLVVVFPPFTDIATVSEAFLGAQNFATGGQNFYPAEQGAFTGEISPAMLADAGASWALTGHSERRHIFDESDEIVAKKTEFGLSKNLKIMLCVGETLEEREAGQLQQVLKRQLSSAIAPLVKNGFDNLEKRLAIAYEPVWAIGTGKVAGPAEIIEAHAEVRKLLKEQLKDVASEMPVLYGGSVKADNATGILALDNVDGLLVGGASLEADSFLKIIKA